MFNYLPNSQAITGEYYANQLEQLQEKICEKWLGMVNKKVLFYHDNTPAHICAIAMAKILELQFKLLPDAPYLDPSDFFLFQS